MDTYFRFEIWFYKENTGNDFTEVTVVNVIADSTESAIKKAKGFDSREYFVKGVTEIVNNEK